MRIRLTVPAFFLVLSVIPALAQDKNPPGGNPPGNNPASTDNAGRNDAMRPPIDPTSTVPANNLDRPRTLQRSSQLLGGPVTRNGKNIGRVEDLMVDVRTGRVAYGVNSFNDVSGAQGNLYPMPWPAGRFSERDNSIEIESRDETIRDAPNFPRGQWPNFNDEEYASRVFDSYNQAPFWRETSTVAALSEANRANAGGNRGSTGQTRMDVTKTTPTGSRTTDRNNADSTSDPRTARTVSDRTNPDQKDAANPPATADWNRRPSDLHRMTEIRGSHVVASDGTRLGEISELVVDPATGRVAYAVTGDDQKRIPIPWDALQPGSNNTYQLNIEADRFARAPTFQPSDWPDMTHTGWSSDVHRFYSTTPYWERNRR